jgi:hypothetical protein
MMSKWPKERIEVTDLFWSGTPCWRWLGAHNKGRPVLNQKYVYRILYERERGRLPQDRDAHHGCEHEWCVNPWHVEPLTHQKHMKLHGELRGNPYQSQKTHCRNGHPFDEVNTRRWKNKRICRACNRAAAARLAAQEIRKQGSWV